MVDDIEVEVLPSREEVIVTEAESLITFKVQYHRNYDTGNI